MEVTIRRGTTEDIEAFGNEIRAKGILIETKASNAGAQKLYESRSYQKVTEWFFTSERQKARLTSPSLPA